MLWESFKKNFLPELWILLACAVLYGVLRMLGVTCVVYEITGVPCPACGMGRAMMSLAMGDLSAYLRYNAMALPVLAAFVLELFSAKLGKARRTINAFAATVLLVNAVYYVFRLVN